MTVAVRLSEVGCRPPAVMPCQREPMKSSPSALGVSRVIVALLAVAGLFAFSAAKAHGADWPSFRGGGGQNLAAAEYPGTAPGTKWTSISSVEVAGNCVLVVGGRVFTISTPQADGGAERVFAIDTSSGGTLWSSPTFESVVATRCIAADSTGVYVPEGNSIVAYGVSSGSHLWTQDLGARVGSPVLSAGRVFVEAGGSMKALDVTDGHTLWTTPLTDTAGRAPLMAPGDGVGASNVVLAHGNESVVALNADTGAALWTHTAATGRCGGGCASWTSGPITDVIAADTSVFVADTSGAVTARDATTGAIAWTHLAPANTFPSGLVADGTRLFVLDGSYDQRFASHKLEALNASDGSLVYSADQSGTGGPYPPFMALGGVLFNHYLAFDSASGNSLGGQSLFDGVYDSAEQSYAPAFSNGVLYAWVDVGGGQFRLVARADVTPPSQFSLASPIDQAVVKSARPELSWDATSDNTGGAGLDHYEVWLDGNQVGGEIGAGTTTFTPSTDVAEGTHVWSVKAVDAAGNARESASRNVTVDTVSPAQFDLRAPEDGAANLPPEPDFSWDATSDATSGVDHYELWIDGSKHRDVAKTSCTSGVCSTSPLGPLGGGSHTWEVHAIDAATNTRTSTSTRSFSIDAAPPTPFGLVTPDDRAEIPTARPALSWEAASDSGSGLSKYQVFIDGTQSGNDIPPNVTTYTPPSGLTRGDHTWYVIAVDQVGNARSSATRSFTVDATPPAAFALVAPGDGAKLSDPKPTLSWASTSDSGSGVASYQVYIDGNPAGGELSATKTDYTPANGLSEGDHIWRVVATDQLGNSRSTTSRTFTIDTASPQALLQVAPNPAATGQTVTFDASRSSDSGTGIIKYLWDLDGDGTFETDSGPSPTVSRTYLSPTTITVGLRVIDAVGLQGQATQSLEVRRRARTGPLGVSINAGAQYTNDPHVDLSVLWPALTSRVLVSNDGGFGTAQAFPPIDAISWTLDSSGPERLPKTIYVRFEGGDAGRETYTDDIILDETPPALAAVDLSGPAAGASAAKVRTHRYTLRIKASDKTSGVRMMQIGNSRKGGSLPFVKFTRKVVFASKTRTIWVRVRDGAGNLSRWRAARVH
jgi:hypothetical protein